MGILLTILYIIGGIIVLFLLIALLTKKEFSLERTIVINRSRAEVFNYARMLKNQEQYSVWVMKDPAIKLVYTGTDGTVGAKSAWESNDKNVGVGEQEIIELVDGQQIKTEVRFKKPFEGTSYALNTFTDEGSGQAKITQSFSGRSKFPMNVMNLVMDKMVGRDMQRNLENMKNNLEKNNL
ncbi:MAG: SRPBCC family protein [Chitinophagaceae bacterium]